MKESSTIKLVKLDDKEVIMKKYALCRVGARRSTIKITLPTEVVEREARRLGISEEEAVEKLLGVWKYNSFDGLHLSFVEKEPKKERGRK